MEYRNELQLQTPIKVYQIRYILIGLPDIAEFLVMTSKITDTSVF